VSDLGNKKILSKNLRKYIEISKKERTEIAKNLGVSYSTFTDWINGNSYPRIDKIEMLANYFKINKSDIIEEHDKNSYYFNNESKEMAQEIFNNPELKVLFNSLRNTNPEDLKFIKEMIEIMKSKEE